MRSPERAPGMRAKTPWQRSPIDMLPSVSPKKNRRRRGRRRRQRRDDADDSYALGSLNGDHGLNGAHDDPEDAYRDDDAQERQLVAMLSQVATGGGSPASQFGQQ